MVQLTRVRLSYAGGPRDVSADGHNGHRQVRPRRQACHSAHSADVLFEILGFRMLGVDRRNIRLRAHSTHYLGPVTLRRLCAARCQGCSVCVVRCQVQRMCRLITAQHVGSFGEQRSLLPADQERAGVHQVGQGRQAVQAEEGAEGQGVPAEQDQPPTPPGPSPTTATPTRWAVLRAARPCCQTPQIEVVR